MAFVDYQYPLSWVATGRLAALEEPVNREEGRNKC
jgi:hypothetical protein